MSDTWNGKVNVIIPMAGRGSRFSDVGYILPKPLIKVNNKPMIQLVIESLNINPLTSNYIYIVQESHYIKYNLESLLTSLTPNCKIVKVNTITEGPVCTALLAEPFLDLNIPVLLANSDQYVIWNTENFMKEMSTCDGGLLCFNSDDTNYSYAKTDDEGNVIEVAEKKVISNNASTGIYYFSNANEFLYYSKLLIKQNIRVNNEFYVCPVYNLLIQNNKKIKVVPCEKMYCLGTPKDLENYLQNKFPNE